MGRKMKGLRFYNNNKQHFLAVRQKEYTRFVDPDGNFMVRESSERKGWTQIPCGAPHGVIVSHATLNIGHWL